MIPLALDRQPEQTNTVEGTPVPLTVRAIGAPLPDMALVALPPAMLAAGLVLASPLLVRGVVWLMTTRSSQPYILSEGGPIGHAIPFPASSPAPAQLASASPPQQGKAKGKQSAAPLDPTA